MNIVTIDFDIIMKPSINFYNDLVDVNEPIKDYIDEFSFLTNVPADLYIYDFLTRYIVHSMLHGCSKVFFINSHETATDIIKEFSAENPVTLYNIDHHHDLGYEMKTMDWKRPAAVAEVGNWVKYCKDRRYIQDYYWIHNDNSAMYPEEASHLISGEYDLKDVNLEEENFKPDVLIICASYEWVPPVYHALYMNWNSICSEIAGEEYPLDTK